MDENTSTKVVIYTAQHRITGRISLLPGARLTDYILHAGPFIALTDVQVTTCDGKALFDADFIDLATNRIEMIMPAEQLRPAI